MENSNKAMEFTTVDVTSSNRKLHTPSEFAKKNLLYVQEVGSLKSLKPHASGRNNLESYLFFMVNKGSGTVTVNNQKYKLSEGMGVLLDCMEAYEHISDEKNPWELSWVHFNGNSAKGYFEVFEKQNDKKPVFKLKDRNVYGKAIETVMQVIDEKDVTSEIRTSLYITQILTEIISDTSGKVSKKEMQNLTKLREAINARYQEVDLFEKLCAEYNIDEITINELFKNKYGIDLCDYILNRRFTCAKEMLRFTVKPVKDIVVESGIGNSDLFRHLFIEKEGMTAEEYRKKWSQWNRG